MFVVDFQKCRVLNFKFDVLFVDWISVNKDSIFLLADFAKFELEKLLKKANIVNKSKKSVNVKLRPRLHETRSELRPV